MTTNITKTLIFKENDISMKIMQTQLGDLLAPSFPWGSDAAKYLAKSKKMEISNITATGKEGKILLADVRRASQTAKSFAKKHNLRIIIE